MSTTVGRLHLELDWLPFPIFLFLHNHCLCKSVVIKMAARTFDANSCSQSYSPWMERVDGDIWLRVSSHEVPWLTPCNASQPAGVTLTFSFLSWSDFMTSKISKKSSLPISGGELFINDPTSQPANFWGSRQPTKSGPNYLLNLAEAH